MEKKSSPHVWVHIKKYMKKTYLIINEIMKQSDVRYIKQVGKLLKEIHAKISLISRKVCP